MIEIKEKQKCCGCWACENVCPKQCITMEMDDEGFRYPVVDKDKCVDCHLCEKACPELKPMRDDSMPLANYIIQQKDKTVLRDSTSGGFFTAISKYVIVHGGAVFGAAFDKDMVLRHTYAERMEDTVQFRGSKYVQSEIQHSYQDALKFLKEGRMVVFSGTPCQIEGLYGFLKGKLYDNLITVGLVCHGVPSPKLFDKYIRNQESLHHSPVVDYRSRDKHYGYDYSTATISFENADEQYHHGMESDLLLRLYFKNLISRPSCYDCHYKTINRISDITIFDCWDAPSASREFSNGGATNVFIYTEKGLKVFDAIKHDFVCGTDDIEKIIQRDGVMMKHYVPKPTNREEFFKDMNTMTIPQLEDKYDHKSILRKTIIGAKPLLYKLGVFGLYMKQKRR